jgi:hypothetical protein
MKAVPLLLFAMSSLSFIVIAPVSIGSSYALKDEDGRFGIITLENLKGGSVEVTIFIYDEDKNKNIKGTPEPIDETSASVKHTFKFDNDDFPNSAGPGTQIITCIEFKNGKGEPSCYTDTLKSESQPYRVTLDVDYIRD